MIISWRSNDGVHNALIYRKDFSLLITLSLHFVLLLFVIAFLSKFNFCAKNTENGNGQRSTVQWIYVFNAH